MICKTPWWPVARGMIWVDFWGVLHVPCPMTHATCSTYHSCRMLSHMSSHVTSHMSSHVCSQVLISAPLYLATGRGTGKYHGNEGGGRKAQEVWGGHREV